LTYRVPTRAAQTKLVFDIYLLDQLLAKVFRSLSLGRVLAPGTRDLGRGGHYSDGRAATDRIQCDRSRLTRADSYLSELVVGPGNRGAVAMATEIESR